MPKTKAEIDHKYAVSEAGRESKRRYNRTAKGKARQKAYNESRKGRDRSKRYDDTTIQVRIVGMKGARYRVPAERKDELVRRLAEFRVNQREERRRARIG